MPKTKITPKTLSMSSTKKEMLEAYKTLLEQLREKAEAKISSERKAEEKKVKEIEELVDSLSSEKIDRETGNLKIEIGKMLGELSERLENAVNKFKDIQKAINLKETELKEVYEIEKAAGALFALIEAQNTKRSEFEAEMERVCAEWEGEKQEEAQKREREKEEYLYAFKREQQLAKDKFEDGKVKLEKEIILKKEEAEKKLVEREKTIAEKEEELKELRKKVNTFPAELESAIKKAVKEITERLQQEAKNREELWKKEFEGERNVLTTRIKSLEETVKRQNEQITRLSQQLEKAYQKIQDIAVKTVEGKAVSSIQGILSEQMKKQT